jgi:putative NADH-flavin reductase
MNNQRVIVFGATGRVGTGFLAYALDAGHQVTAFVRTPAKLTVRHPNLNVVQGDATVLADVTRALEPGFDAVVMTVGADPLKPSTVVQDSVKTIVEAMNTTGVRRYLGITGTAQMPATPMGAVTQFFIRRLIAAAADHQRAFETVVGSTLDYALVACPYIKDGARTGAYQIEPGRFPGGFKTISAPDVADFLAKEVGERRYHRQTVGIWR